jgi:molecular chaperone GrpE
MTKPEDGPETTDTPAPAGMPLSEDHPLPVPTAAAAVPEVPGSAPPAEAEAPEVTSEVAAGGCADVEAELAEWKDRHLRLAAEYDNFRKRVARERDELRTRAQADLARRLLEALDDLGRVAHLDPSATAAPDVIAGVELVERKVLRELVGAGLEAVTAIDVPFDPGVHEAIATVAAASPEQDHTVAAVFQPGYRFNGTLLRPARVQVRIFSEPAPSD